MGCIRQYESRSGVRMGEIPVLDAAQPSQPVRLFLLCGTERTGRVSNEPKGVAAKETAILALISAYQPSPYLRVIEYLRRYPAPGASRGKEAELCLTH